MNISTFSIILLCFFVFGCGSLNEITAPNISKVSLESYNKPSDINLEFLNIYQGTWKFSVGIESIQKDSIFIGTKYKGKIFRLNDTLSWSMYHHGREVEVISSFKIISKNIILIGKDTLTRNN